MNQYEILITAGDNFTIRIFLCTRILVCVYDTEIIGGFLPLNYALALCPDSTKYIIFLKGVEKFPVFFLSFKFIYHVRILNWWPLWGMILSVSLSLSLYYVKSIFIKKRYFFKFVSMEFFFKFSPNSVEAKYLF